MPPPATLCGVVVSAGKMMKAVKVRTAKQVYNSFLKKHFVTHDSHLVSDPTSSLRTGDVVRIASGWPTSRRIKHVVTEIVAPFGEGIEERPRLLSEEERVEARRIKRDAKSQRREERRAAERAEKEEEDQGRRRQKIVETARRRGKRAVENEAVAESLQVGLDEGGVGEGEAWKRLEEVGR